jgi:predicted nicotinamide N-methyase
VVITDGHPDCVKNQNMCIQMNEQALEKRINKTENSPNNTVFNNKYLRSTCSVSTSLLRWSVGDTHNDIKNLRRNKFDIIIAADCLFFEDFHDDFIWILKNCLEKNGFCFLLQPKRGKSMDNFMLKIRAREDFLVVSASDDYDDKVRQ